MPFELVPSSIALESLTSIILEGVSLFELGILDEPLELRPPFFLDADDLRRKGMTIVEVRERGRRRNTENKGQMTAAVFSVSNNDGTNIVQIIGYYNIC